MSYILEIFRVSENLFHYDNVQALSTGSEAEDRDALLGGTSRMRSRQQLPMSHLQVLPNLLK